MKHKFIGYKDNLGGINIWHSRIGLFREKELVFDEVVVDSLFCFKTKEMVYYYLGDNLAEATLLLNIKANDELEKQSIEEIIFLRVILERYEKNM